MKKFCINVLQCRHSVGWAWTRASVMWSLLHGLTLVRRVILSTSQFCCVCASISIFSNESMWRKVQSTYTVCGCAGVTKRLGPASENGPESSSNMLKPKGSLPNSPPPPIIPNKKHAQSIVIWPTMSCFADWSKCHHVTFSIIMGQRIRDFHDNSAIWIYIYHTIPDRMINESRLTVYHYNDTWSRDVH